MTPTTTIFSGSQGVAAPRRAPYHAYLAYATAGFRRDATYRQAMVAAIFTNSIFGFLRSAVLLAVAGAGGVAGYDTARLVTFVWAGQGLIGVVLLWALTELADRIRSGDVIADLLRPVDLVWQQLASDLGRAGFAVLTRFVGPILIGALTFGLYTPRRLATYLVFACSVVLATVICFGCRYLVNAAAYWLLDVRARRRRCSCAPVSSAPESSWRGTASSGCRRRRPCEDRENRSGRLTALRNAVTSSPLALLPCRHGRNAPSFARQMWQ